MAAAALAKAAIRRTLKRNEIKGVTRRMAASLSHKQ